MMMQPPQPQPQPPPPPPPPPQQQQQSPSSSTLRSLTTPAQSPAPLAQAPSASHRHPDRVAVASPAASLQMPARVRLSDMAPYDGSPSGTYLRAVEALSGSLARHNAVIVELGCEDAALMRCGLEAARLYFRTRAQPSAACGKASGTGRGIYMYRPRGAVEDRDASPPCMVEIYRCMGKAARAALCTIARHLRLRSDAFNHLLDDIPLPDNEVSSSVLVATFCHTSSQNGKGTLGRVKPAFNGEVEKGLLTLVSSDNLGLQVCDPNGHWYIADCGLAPGDLLLITGKALTHATAGLHHAALYRVASDYLSGTNNGGRTSLMFRLMPQSNAILDCSPIVAAGHVISQSYVPISVSQFMDDLSAEEEALGSGLDDSYVARDNLSKEPSLRSVLSDPLSGAFLEDAMVVSCGHSFGGLMLRKVLDMSRCTLCSAEILARPLIPNFALRAAAAAIKHEDERRLFHNAALRKRRKEMGDQTDINRRPNGENGDIAAADGLHKGVHYPFAVNEKVIIKGNRRTPEKFVGKEAIITSQCLNGWYLLKIIGSSENVRLQYRSLQKILTPEAIKDRCASQPIQNSST